MKKNAILLLFLASLMTFTYFFDERREERRRKQQEENSRLFVTLDKLKQEDILSIQTLKAKLSKKGGIFVTRDGHPVGPRKLEEFFLRLSSIRIKRILTSDETAGLKDLKREDFFPHPHDRFVFIFKERKVSFLLGKKLDVGQDFYVEVLDGDKKTWAIAYDSSAREDIFTKEEEKNSPYKYLRFKSLLLLEDKFFKEFHLFPLLLKGLTFKIKMAKIHNKRNRPFELYFSPLAITPSPWPLAPLSISSRVFQKWKKDIENLKAREVYLAYDASKLQREFSTVILESVKGRKISFVLYRRYGGRSGYFVEAHGALYELGQDEAAPFFFQCPGFFG